MPKYNCCVPGCTNSHRNKASGFKFYCLPTDSELRKKYDVLIRNDNLKVTSTHTRICCEHWEGGQKLSRTHLPSIFPWTESKQPRRVIAKASQETIENHKRKRKNSTNISDMSDAMEIKDPEPEATQLDCSTQTDLPCFCNAEIEVKRLKDEKNELQEETLFLKSELKRISDELNTVKTNFVRLQQQQTKFDIEQYKSNDTDIEFYTGLPNYKMLLFCFELVQASNNVCEREGEINQKTPKIGRPRALTAFQEYIMVLMRLRLGLFERDLAHRFGNIALGTVSNITLLIIYMKKLLDGDWLIAVQV
ncbi:uncharacterized protein LOC110248722 [Exaiptasia diaphana]|uniref:THAP-type domain-containing protein n=1 Tax=Exaiptasia diaphana TaxID=2652724 RepID=A0A913YU74_EXADI|nr:uncharacterized protein LOC110248722 [Exaiptasia diaphana]